MQWSDRVTGQTVTLRYFAWVREKIGRAEDRVVLPETVATVADLVAWLKTRGPEYVEAFRAEGAVRVALDKVHGKQSAQLAGVGEIAFFPPVTGG